MRILIALAEPFLPQQSGGSQISALEMASSLRREGSDVAIAAVLKRKSLYGALATGRMILHRAPFERDTFADTSVYRVPGIKLNIGRVVEHHQPDVVLVQAMAAMPMAHTLNELGVPMVIYWHDVETHRMNGSPAGLSARYIANSNFTASFYQTNFGVSSTVVPPLIQRERYAAAEHARRSVVFVGLTPEKGLDVALGVAGACPEIAFEFVESWLLPPRRKAAIVARLRALPNASFVPHQSSMIPLYARARLLLAPSQWQEAWGRVASEAHINGVPVIGSDIGGLPESIGPGGVLVSPTAPVAEWADQVRTLWHDEPRYRRLSAAAEAYSRRPELDPKWATQRIAEELTAQASL